MTLPAADVAAVKRFCEERLPPDSSDQMRLEVVEERDALTIVERQPPWLDDPGAEWTSSDIARLRYAAKDALWTLYEPDSNGRWHRYGLVGPARDIATLLAAIERDETGIFWG